MKQAIRGRGDAQEVMSIAESGNVIRHKADQAVKVGCEGRKRQDGETRNLLVHHRVGT